MERGIVLKPLVKSSAHIGSMSFALTNKIDSSLHQDVTSRVSAGQPWQLHLLLAASRPLTQSHDCTGQDVCQAYLKIMFVIIWTNSFGPRLQGNGSLLRKFDDAMRALQKKGKQAGDQASFQKFLGILEMFNLGTSIG